MIQVHGAIEALAAELQAAMDEEIGLLEHKRSLLEQLSAAMIQRDEGAIEKLLEQFDRAGQSQSTADARLAAVREGLAEALGLDAEAKVRLSDLLRRLPPRVAATLDVRRRQVQRLVERLREQHAQTALLLMESARLNRLLLRGLLTGGGGLTTYSPGGRNDWNGRSGLIDTAR